MNGNDSAKWFKTHVKWKVWNKDLIVEDDDLKAICFDDKWECSVKHSYDMCIENLDKKYPREKFPSVWFDIEAKVMWM